MTTTDHNLPLATSLHTELVRALRKDGQQILDELTPAKADMQHMAIGISGEAGELLDAIKRWTIYSKDLDRDNVIEELGDLEFFMEGLRQGLNITRNDTLRANINKLNKRYSEKKFTNEAAQARADKA